MDKETMKAFIISVNNMNKDNGCPLEIAMDILAGKWRMRTFGLIATREAYRFGQIKKELPGITNTMLANTLRDLERLGLIMRVEFDELPFRVEYSLTEAGEELFPGIYEWTKWSVKYIDILRAFHDENDKSDRVVP